MTNCGPNGNDCCCTNLMVTGGTFYRTYDQVNALEGGFQTAADGGPYQADPATVSTFRLDKYEVTVGRFRQFVNAWNAGWLPRAGSGKHGYLNGGKGLKDGPSGPYGAWEGGWYSSDDDNVSPTDANLSCVGGATWTSAPGPNENLPVNCVSWFEAYAFCIWDGGFLPSEAEWQYAAAGGSQQREYPWGSVDPGTSNQYAIYGDGAAGDCYYPSGTLVPCTGVANIAPVGTATLGAGLWGQLDLAGNVSEWNLDSYSYGTYVDPCVDCANVTAGSGRAIMGGSFNNPKTYLFPPDIFLVTIPADRFNNLGLRCSRTP